MNYPMDTAIIMATAIIGTAIETLIERAAAILTASEFLSSVSPSTTRHYVKNKFTKVIEKRIHCTHGNSLHTCY